MCLPYQALVVWQHDNDLCIMIPNHSPEIFRSVWQRMLGYDELVASIIPLQLEREEQLVAMYMALYVCGSEYFVKQDNIIWLP